MDNVDGLVLVGTVVGVLVFVLGCVRFIEYLLEKARQKGKWEGEVDSDRKKFDQFMNQISQRIDEIWKHLGGKPVSESTSPISLTDFGRSISERVGAKKWSHEESIALIEELRGFSEYQVQEFCNGHVWKKILGDDELKARVENCAYQEGIDTEKVAEVISIELRDAVLSHRE